MTPEMFVAAIAWAFYAGFQWGERCGEKRGSQLGIAERPPTTYVKLPCFGGPRDGETVRFASSCEQLRIPYLDGSVKPAWSPDGAPFTPLPQSFIRQAMYRRLWMGNREQLVYQGTIDG